MKKQAYNVRAHALALVRRLNDSLAYSPINESCCFLLLPVLRIMPDLK